MRSADRCRAGWHAAPRPRRQRGTTLAVVSLLLFCMALMLLYAVRARVSELRLAGHGVQARVLLAAAQSGLETALAQAGALMQETAPVFDAQGRAELPGPSAELAGGIRLRTALHNRGLTPFDMELIEVESRASDAAGGERAVRQQARLRPWLAHPPPAPLVVGRDADLPGAVELINDAGAVLAWSGGPFVAPLAALRLAGEPLCPPAGICEDDARIAALPAAGLFEYFFERDPALLRALAAGAPAVLWVGGEGVSLSGAFGSEEAPVLLVADGDLALGGDVSVDGLLYVQGDWLPGTGSLEVRGAMIVAGQARHQGPVRLHYRPDHLARLAETGAYARIAGSWIDF